MEEKKLTVGKVVAVQGNKGEVRVYPLTDFPDRFTPALKVDWVDGGNGQPLTVQGARLHKGMIIVKFSGYDSISAAETLVGGELQVDRTAAVKLPPGHYYFDEIVGLSVYTTRGDYLGKVTEVLRTGSNDIYVVATEQADILLPAIKDVVKAIDPAAGKMTVEILDGLV